VARLVGQRGRAERGRGLALPPFLARRELSYAAIAARLGVTPTTAEGRVRRLAHKLGVTPGRGAVVEAARQRGLLAP